MMHLHRGHMLFKYVTLCLPVPRHSCLRVEAHIQTILVRNVNRAVVLRFVDADAGASLEDPVVRGLSTIIVARAV